MFPRLHFPLQTRFILNNKYYLRNICCSSSYIEYSYWKSGCQIYTPNFPFLLLQTVKTILNSPPTWRCLKSPCVPLQIPRVIPRLIKRWSLWYMCNAYMYLTPENIHIPPMEGLLFEPPVPLEIPHYMSDDVLKNDILIISLYLFHCFTPEISSVKFLLMSYISKPIPIGRVSILINYFTFHWR